MKKNERGKTKKGIRMQFKFSMPVAFILILSLLSISGLSYYYSTNMINDNMKSQTSSQVEEITIMLENQVNAFNELKEEVNAQSISKAKAFALMIAQNPEILNSQEALNNIKDTLGVKELHVCDENGILKWGTVTDFFGFDFNTTDQTKPFMPALTDKNFELAQEPSERGVDKVLFQYISVARQDAPGIVQVGLEPDSLMKALSKSDIKVIAPTIVFGNSGYVFIVDKNTNLIVSHKDPSYIGVNIEDFDFYSKFSGQTKGDFSYTQNGVEKFLSFDTSGDYIVFATIPTEEFTGGLGSFLRSIGIIAIIALLLSTTAIYLLVRYYITNEMSKLLKVLRNVGIGDLTQEANAKSTKEFTELSIEINSMISSLKEIISSSISATVKLEDSSKKLVVSADHTSKGAEEIAATVNELAQSSNEQADNATTGAMLAKDALIKLEEIETDVKDTVHLTDLTKKAVEKGISTVQYQNEKMEHNVTSVQTVDKAVKSLSDKANEIGSIINVITGIADQTNMLALNAAIEAARAGEAGKGFAVVADEVRKLAESSTLSAQQISKIINEIQTGIENVKAQAGASISAVEEQKSSVLQTQQAFEEISTAASSTLEQVNKIYKSTDMIVTAVHGMVEVTEGAAAAAQQSAAGTQEISASTEEQSASLEEITQIANDLTEMVKELNAISSKFKLS